MRRWAMESWRWRRSFSSDFTHWTASFGRRDQNWQNPLPTTHLEREIHDHHKSPTNHTITITLCGELDSKIHISKLLEPPIALGAHSNPDQYLRHVTEAYASRLHVWASRDEEAEVAYGVLALAVLSRWPAWVAP